MDLSTILWLEMVIDSYSCAYVVGVFYNVLTGDWSTKFMWLAGRDDPLNLGIRKQSIATLWWNVSSEVSPGTYKLCYHGDHKVAKVGVAIPFQGCSSTFQVTL